MPLRDLGCSLCRSCSADRCNKVLFKQVVQCAPWVRFEAAMQAIVAHSAIAVAITRVYDEAPLEDASRPVHKRGFGKRLWRCRPKGLLSQELAEVFHLLLVQQR